MPLDDALDELVREVPVVFVAGPRGNNRHGVLDQLTDNWNWPGSRSDHDLGILTQSQAEFQHVPSFLRILVLSKLIYPRLMELGTWELVWLFTRVQKHLRAVGPRDSPLGRLIFWSPVRGTNRQYPRFALHQHVTGIALGFGNSGDPDRDIPAFLNPSPNCFRSHPSLAVTPASKVKPNIPIARRSFLFRAGPE